MLHADFKICSTFSKLVPLTTKLFCLEVKPETSSTCPPRSRENCLINSLLTFPFTGGQLQKATSLPASSFNRNCLMFGLI